MSRFIAEPIRWLEASSDGHIYTALEGGVIAKWNKMNLVQEYRGHSKPIIKFIVSTEFIFSLAEEGEFIMFNAKNGQIVKRMKFDHEFDQMMHPSTYINKLVFAGAGGKLELWNVIDQKLIYAFPKLSASGEERGEITSIAQSPVLHTIAIGYSSGEILLFNLQTDAVLFSFRESDSVSTLSFSSDTTLGVSMLASTSRSHPAVTLWDLNKQKVHTVL